MTPPMNPCPNPNVPGHLRALRSSSAVVCLGLLFPPSAFAYVDPNAGGLLYQILFPLIVAIGAAWAGLRHRIGYWWARLRGRLPEEAPEQPADPGAAPASTTAATGASAAQPAAPAPPPP